MNLPTNGEAQGRIQGIFFDLDGTLLNNQKKISALTERVFRHLKQAGLPLFLSTGRGYRAMERYLKILEPGTPVITYNGAAVQEPETGRELRGVFQNPEILQTLLRLGRSPGVSFLLYRRDGRFFYLSETENIRRYEKSAGFSGRPLEEKTAGDFPILKSMFIGEHERLKEIRRALEQEVPGKFTASFSHHRYLEVMAPEVSKGKALREIVRERGWDLERVMAFGDGLNDKEMLECVGYGVLMANGMDELKECCALRAGSNEEDGVARFLKGWFVL